MPKKKRNNLSDFLQMYYNKIEEHIETEEWKPIILGDKILYEISNHGRVRRFDTKYIINPFHSYRKNKDGSFNYDRPTYLRVQLYYYENGKRKKKHEEISRLVAKTFIPVPKEYIDLGYTMDTLEVNHIKGGIEIYNNFVDNLEWCTTKENIIKSVETGLRHPPKGEKHHATFVDEKLVIEICKNIENENKVKKTYENISKSYIIEYKQFKSLFYNIKYKNSWVFISQHFNF